MLTYTTGDIFESPAQTLVNTVNTVGVMGKGIAAEYRKQYPEMFQRYRSFCIDGLLDVGNLYLYRTPHKWVLNFPTKKHWRSPSRIEWIESGLQKLLSTYETKSISSIAFPQLGCGNGGLDWGAVKPVMEHYLRQLTIPVHIHVRRPPEGFVPEHANSWNSSDTTAQRLRQQPVEVMLESFLTDTCKALGWTSQQAEEFLSSSHADNARFTFSAGNLTRELCRAEVESIWDRLTFQGVVAVRDVFRDVNNDHLESEIAGCFAELPYVKKTEVLAHDGQWVMGLKYVPESSQQLPVIVALPQEM